MDKYIGRKLLSRTLKPVTDLISSSPSREVDSVGDVLLLGQREQEVQHHGRLPRAGGTHNQDGDVSFNHLIHEEAQARVLVC